MKRLRGREAQNPESGTNDVKSDSLLICWGMCLLLCSTQTWAGDVRPDVRDRFPYAKPQIDYFGDDATNPVADLDLRLREENSRLKYEPPHGYLRSLLRVLDISVESQVLVFSKTSVNRRLISPQTPRAIYFNDQVYVAWIPEIAALEISAADAKKGGMFYTLSQDPDLPQRFVRAKNCLTCHASTNSLQVPGHLARSFLTDQQGEPLQGRSWINHDTPLRKRWGGWYVTGHHGDQPHQGNIFGANAIQRYRQDPLSAGNVTDLSTFFDVKRYLTPHSDIVALMVLEHQAYVQNLLARLNYEIKLGREPTVEGYLLRYLFFVDEPPLTEEIVGTSRFAETFEARGPEDSRGRSLRQFELQTRLFKYRLSYQIYSPAFQQLPDQAKVRMYRRIWHVLIGEEPDKDFAKLAASERSAILEIMRETIVELPDYYHEDRATNGR